MFFIEIDNILVFDNGVNQSKSVLSVF